MSPKQVVVIGGGDAYPDYETYFAHLANAKIESAEYFKPHTDWKASLGSALGAGYDVLVPSMPNKQNARFTE